MNLVDLDDGQLAYLITEGVKEQARRALARIDENDETRLWPQPVFDAALEVFGPVIYGEGRVRKALDRRIRFALDVWVDKYGLLNAEQQEYATQVLASAIRAGGKAANGNPPYAIVYARLLDVVNHETVHGGFQKRSGAVQRDLQTPGMREAG